MKIQTKATGLKLTEEIKNFIQSKMDKLEKYLGSTQVLHCEIEIARESNHHKKGEIFRTEVNLELPGSLLRVEKTEKDLFKSIEKVKDHLARSIKKYKEKLITKKRKIII